MATPLADKILLQTRNPPEDASSKSRSRTSSGSPPHVLIYFIPGNPGLIEYYRPFLTHLVSLLQPLTDDTGTIFHIAGHSLSGFHVNPNATGPLLCQPLPLNLLQQIEEAELRICSTARLIQDVPATIKHEPMPTIMIGHSVGSYILMSLLERYAKHTAEDEGAAYPGRSSHYVSFLAGVCLFPTVVDLYASHNGRKVGWVAPIPGFSLLLHASVKLLCYLISFTTLVKLVERATGQPHAAAKVTASFLASPSGVRQAIYMAQHELLEMRADRWSDEVWGAPASQTKQPGGTDQPSIKIPNLFFYWGANDHWIDNMTRDAVIASRAATSTRTGPRMEIDTQGTPHDFCVRDEHSKLVAEKVAGYIGGVLTSSMPSR